MSTTAQPPGRNAVIDRVARTTGVERDLVRQVVDQLVAQDLLDLAPPRPSAAARHVTGSGLSVAITGALEQVRRAGELTDAELAEILGRPGKGVSVATWRRGERVPSRRAWQQRILETQDVFTRMDALLDPAGVSTWVRRPVPRLGGRTILDTLAAGDLDQVHRVLDAIEQAGAS